MCGLPMARRRRARGGGFTDVVDRVRSGELGARAQIRGTCDEFDELAEGVNEMLDPLERSMAGHKHAGDAISPMVCGRYFPGFGLG